MFNPNFVTPLERERRRKAKEKPMKSAKTISVDSSIWCLLELISIDHPNIKNANEGVAYCITQIGISEGKET